MKVVNTLQLITLLLISSAVHALDIKSYTPEIFAEKQKNNEVVALHFHADWCPTCRAQTKILNEWNGINSVPGTLLVVDYDTERDLKKRMAVHVQSTIIIFKGATEKARLAGNTDRDVIRTAFQAAQ